LIATVMLLLVVPSASATFPGPSGRIAFVSNATGDYDVWTMDADGGNKVQIQQLGGSDRFPAWSPDGREIAFTRGTALWSMEAQGGNSHQLTFSTDATRPAWSPDATKLAYGKNGRVTLTSSAGGAPETPVTTPPTSPAQDGAPDWSPDGNRIVFQRTWAFGGGAQYSNIVAIDPDGTDEVDLTTGTTFEDTDPSISPDGSTVVFRRQPNVATGSGPAGLFVVPIGGGSPTQLTNLPSLREDDPAWSPDGSKIAFTGFDFGGNADIYVIDSDGTNLLPLTSDGHVDAEASWQRIVPAAGFPRPKGATPIRLSLVPAYNQCTSPNRTHGPPLAFGSCNPPAQSSGVATVGTADANGFPAQSTGYLSMTAIAGDPGTPADEADVAIALKLTDVRMRATPSTGYAASLSVRLPIRLTDKNVGCCGISGTTMDFSNHDEGPAFQAPCASVGAGIGSTCEINTTADSLIPGAVPEGKRNLWQLTEEVRVYDAGADGNASIVDDNTLLATQGVFVP
jgi:TolB protein